MAKAILKGITIFQSTLPAWGATWARADDGHLTRISIHAPRMGSDSKNGEVYDLFL